MDIRKSLVTALLALSGTFLCMQLAAQIVPAGDEQAFGDLVEGFQDFLGADSASVVSALRNGEAIQLSDGAAGAIEVENANAPMGYGEVSLTLGLAESLAGPDASRQEIAMTLRNEVEGGILDLRDASMGWGQIFDSYGLQVGDVMSRLNANQAAQARLVIDRERPIAPREISRRPVDPGQGRPEARPDIPERVQQARPARPERPVQPELPDRPARPNLLHRR